MKCSKGNYKSKKKQIASKVLTGCFAVVVALSLGFYAPSGVMKAFADTGNTSSSQISANDQLGSDWNGGGLQVKAENKQPYHYSDGTDRPPVISGNISVTNTLDYNNPDATTHDPVHPDRIKVSIQGYFDISQTSLSNLASMSTCGSSWMALMWLPSYMDADGFVRGVQKAYDDNPDSFVVKMYDGDINPVHRGEFEPLANMNLVGSNFIQPYDGINHDKIDQHGLQMTGRGDALAGKWDAFKNIYTGAKDTSDIFMDFTFYVDVHAATQYGLAGQDNGYFDKSPDAYLTKDILPPAPKGNLNFSIEFYDCDQVASSYAWPNKELHIKADQKGYPVTLTKTSNIETWCYFTSPWDSTGYYNTVPNTLQDVVDENGVPIKFVLPSNGYLNPYINKWDEAVFGPVDSLKNMQMFSRAVNIFGRQADPVASAALQPTGVQVGQNFIVTYTPSSEICPIFANGHPWNTYFRDQDAKLSIGNPVGE